MTNVPRGKRISRPKETVSSLDGSISGNSSSLLVRRRKSPWVITLIDSATVERVDGHPLDGLSDAERQKTRCTALGQVLAAIARRQNYMVDN